jgi:hypothetical protein
MSLAELLGLSPGTSCEFGVCAPLGESLLPGTAGAGTAGSPFTINVLVLAAFLATKNATNSANHATQGISRPANPILEYDRCATRVQNRAEKDGEIIEIVSGVSFGNMVLGCIGTGPLWEACEAAIGGVELLNLGVTTGAKHWSIWEGENRCLQ